ncbi:2-C-methyl-D-erythritol 4-phosphate cytidylyltransferase [Methylophilus sp. TWE2]|uniref:2-C-methyl-D-erythritol 4-phosphate cytidylyltransferase n=1 Tax=Methylophilus sp. TWE2 TaxID=1662285 RepID=UPI000671162D|nr:2-C-methyl-D-erythritol 4-phosphate cytidylyltransferase [Methylophilus sp. TWE2]AKR43891.1 2-C-methyl-D-erythritol 4-phosphate cytidylyltransferase [Methylophilus sp. TWE2]
MTQYHVLIPCAGHGSRMQSASPKQYLPMHGKPILRHPIDIFEAMPIISQIFIVIAAEDAYWSDTLLQGCHKTQVLYCGGDTRAASVYQGLQALGSHVDSEDWVLVHDAARPGIDAHMVQRLIDAMQPTDIGGLLALPLADTLKRADETQHVSATVSRELLWQAQTPQMFKIGMLQQALAQVLNRQPTDEAQAMEWAGHTPKLVLGDLKNLKVTYPHDIAVVSALMQATQSEQDTE